MKTSFFKEYFLYRLRALRPYFITSCILSFISGPVPLTILAIQSAMSNGDLRLFEGYSDSFYVAMMSLYILILSIPALIALGVIMPIASRKYLNHRDCADTFGALPLTYNQRYWGDLLSELAAYITPIIPAGIYSCVMMKVYMGNISEARPELYISLTVGLFLSVLVSALGAVALSGFMAQCCGKTSFGLMYAFIIGLLLPVVVMEYGNIIENNALGIPQLDAAAQACSAVPPFGMLFKLFADICGYGFTEESLTVSSPLLLAIMLVIIAAWIVGGYYVGKKRKAELIGEGTLFKAVSLVFSVIAALSILGFFLDDIDFDGFDIYVIITLVVTFIVFMGFELLTQLRGMKFLRSLIVYGCVVVAGFGFAALMHFTESFGLTDYLPSANSVREITVDGGSNIYNDKYVFDDEDAIRVILDRHRKLLESKDKLHNGYELKISYKLKNGTSLTRGYYSDESIIDEFFNEVVKLPQSEDNRFTILAREDVSLTMTVRFQPEIDDYEPMIGYTVKPEKTSELRKALYEDIRDNFDDFIDGVNEPDDYFASINTEYRENNRESYSHYIIPFNYKRTIEFLSDHGNLTTSTRTEFSDTDKYRVHYTADGVDISLTFSDEEGNRLPDEFRDMLSAGQPDTEYSRRFTITKADDYNDIFYIRKSDEERARELFFEALDNYKIDYTGSFYPRTVDTLSFDKEETYYYD